MKSIKKLLWISLVMILLVSIGVANLTSASPETYFWVDPPEVEETPDGKFAIKINIAEAPTTYAWEITINWDPDRLELVTVTEGDFLHRWEYDPFFKEWFPKYDTVFVYDPLDAANLEGQIRVGTTLKGDLPKEEWASGSGWLCTLDFLVQAKGAAHLNLFDTRLWDHLEFDPTKGDYYPAYRYYDSADGLVKATNFYSADLAGWKLKVNGKAGISEEGGHKTTVGTENLLEAMVMNTGNFDVEVQALFEIRDSAGIWIATVESDIVPLPAGESTTLSATWTADSPGFYYITAYSFYSAPPPVPTVTIPGGFSKTVRLKAVY